MSAPLAGILQLCSPALPVGGFAYSRGLEMAVELGWVRDAQEARAWIGGLWRSSIATLDAPLVLRLHDAFAREAHDEIARWSRFAIATRETAELRRESCAVGRATARLLLDLGLASDAEVRGDVRDAHVATFALAALRLSLDREQACRAYLWTTLEAAVAAAIKLVPLGQTEGQRILLSLGAELDELAQLAGALDDSELGSFTPSLTLASALHETQHTRLFRS